LGPRRIRIGVHELIEQFVRRDLKMGLIRACGLDLESPSLNNDYASIEMTVDCHSFNLHAQELQRGMASVGRSTACERAGSRSR
jgi:hypothetical protein